MNLINGLLIESPRGNVKHYREKELLNELKEKIGEIAVKNPKRCKELLKEGLSLNKQARELLDNKKHLDLKSLVRFVIRLSLLATILPFYAANTLEKNNITNKKLFDLINKLRVISYYPIITDNIIIPCAIKELENRGINDKDAINVITYNELINHKKIDIENRLSEFRKNKTFIYENLDGVEKINLVEDPLAIIREIEGNKINNSDIIKGISAYKGKVSGRVRLVLTNKLNEVEFNDGEILVAPSTSPGVVPLFKRAGAIITDEGGVASHAAIVSREMKKPCIIGTKIATQVLQDGDLVEVDANNGVVKILERAREKGKFYIVQSRPITTLSDKVKMASSSNSKRLSKYKFDDYVRMFAGKSFGYLFSDIFLQHYNTLGVLSVQDSATWMSFLPKSSKQKTLEEGKNLYTNKNVFDEYNKEFHQYMKDASKYFESALDKPKLNAEEVIKFLDLASKHFFYYAKTEFFYTDLIDQESMVISIAEFDKLKLKGRVYLNKILFVGDGYVRSLIKKISKQTGVLESDLFSYDIEEFIELVKNKTKINASKINDRNLFFHSKEDTLLGEHSKEITEKFISRYQEISNVIKGSIVNKGKVQGKARVFSADYKNFDKLAIAVKEMQKGEIIIAESTAPEIIAAAKKAAAIVTNQGGMLSHAAIISRELGIPCVIGTDKNVILNIHTGDLVEVDADNGIVRILKKASDEDSDSKLKKKQKILDEEENKTYTPSDWHHFGRWIEPVLTTALWMDISFDELDFGIISKFYVLKGNYFFLKKDLYNIEGFIEDKIKNDYSWFDKFFSLCDKRIRDLMSYSNKKDIEGFLIAGKRCLSASFAVELIDYGLHKYIEKISPKDNLTVNDIFSNIKPNEITPIMRFQKELGKLDKRYIDEFVKKYEWVRFHMFTGEPLNRNRVLEELKNITLEKKDKNNVIKFPKKYDSIIKVGSKLAYLRSFIVETFNKISFYYKPLIKKIAEKNNLSWDNILLLTHEEVIELNKTGKKALDYQKRKHGFGIIRKNNQYRVVIGDELDNLLSSCQEKVETNISELKGMVAYKKGKITGVVKIIEEAKYISKLKPGEILVANETTPDYVIGMKIAGAIITNQGGITSHAAIISRELGIPCIIGTMIATKVLNDGDLVEVDADKGIIKILKKAGEKTTPKVLTNIFSREKSLIYFCTWDESDRKGMNLFGENIKNNLFIVPSEGDKGSVWYEKEELDYLKKKNIEYFREIKDNKFWNRIKNLSINSWNHIEPYAKEKKIIKNHEEFHDYYNNLVNFWICLNSIICEIIESKDIANEIRDYLINFREKTERYTEKMSLVLTDYLKNNKKLKNIYNYVTISEALDILNEKTNQQKLEEIKDRTNGCFMLNSSVYSLEKLDSVLDENNLSFDNPKIMVNLQSREHSLVYCYVWQKANQEFSGDFFKKVKNMLFINKGFGKTSVWYEGKELGEIYNQSGIRSDNDLSYFPYVKKEFHKYYNLLRDYHNKKLKINSIEDLKKYYKTYIDWWSPMAVMYVLPESKTASKKIQERALKIRSETEKYSDENDKFFIESFKRICPEYKEIANFLTPDEMFNSNSLTHKDIETIKSREKGYILFNGELYELDKLNDLLEKNNLILEKQEDIETDEIKGQVAFPGKVKGKVRIIHSKKQLYDFKDNEILVTEMTSPDYVPYMKKALAIITDEGGINCHASIVARELYKPCIIGTKIATKVLHDGDLVEVDADKGIIKIIERVSDEKKEKDNLGDEKDTININGKEWKLAITRNMSLWHQLISSEGLYGNQKDFGIDFNVDSIMITEDSTKTSWFIDPKNYKEYSQTAIDYLNSNEKIKKLKEKYVKYGKELLDSLKKLNSKLNNKNFIVFVNKYRRYCAGLTLTTALGRYGSDILISALKEKGIKEDEIDNIVATITYPDETSPLFSSQFELMNISNKIKKGKISKKKYDIELKKWLIKYGHIPVNFCDEPWLLSDVKLQIDEMLKEDYSKQFIILKEERDKRLSDKKKILNDLNDKRISNLAQIISEGTFLNEYRKNIFSKVSLKYRELFKKISEKFGSSDWKDCWYLNYNEMSDVISGKKIYFDKIKRERKIVGSFINNQGKSVFLDNDSVNKLKMFTDKLYGKGSGNNNTMNQVKGFSANKGLVRGIVRIILGSEDFYKISRGEILVTTMTSVDFVPIMEKAAAFVTNEGGITSHAAIVAREMNKPCIIGTKIATQILKDGDLVEVDADNGVVRILERKNERE